MRPFRHIRRLLGAALVTVCAYAPVSALAEVKVGYSDWPGWVAWAIAEQKGFFKKHGANVKLVWFANYSDSIAALSSGQVDANCQTWSDTMAPIAKGVPLKAVGSLAGLAGSGSPKARLMGSLVASKRSLTA